MPTILINTNVINTNNDNSEYKKTLDEEFRKDLNDLINKLLIKSNLVKINFILLTLYFDIFSYNYSNIYSLIHFQSNMILTI